MNKPTELKITEDAPEGLINEASMSAARELIGSKLRPEQFLRDASVDSITIFSNGIGDLNPLYRDQEYARWTRFGGLIAHPCFPWTHHWPGRSYWGLPGVHGFGVAIDCEYMRNVRPGDRISIWNRVIDVQEKQSKFSGKMAMQYLESTYINQRDEIICRALGLTARHERTWCRYSVAAYQYRPRAHPAKAQPRVWAAWPQIPSKVPSNSSGMVYSSVIVAALPTKCTGTPVTPRRLR
mgnify:CR=1 FL=1